MAGADLTVAARPHPFRLDRRVETVPHGLSIAEIVERVLDEPAARRHAVVTCEGTIVPRERWSAVPDQGSRLTVTVVPASGELLRPILSLAVVVAAAVAAPYVVGALGITQAAGWSAAAVSAATAATTATLSATALLGLSALVPPETAELGSAGRKAKIWSLDRATNDVRLYSAIPRVLGRHRYTPPLAADVVPETDGIDSWLRIAVCWGYGPIELHDLRFGETPVSQVPGVEVEHFLGTPGQTPSLTLYPDDVAVDRVDAVLTAEGGPVVRRSAPAADEIVVQIVLPRGLYSLSRGEREALRVRYTIETAPVGGTWSVRVDEELHKSTTSPIRRTHRLTVSGQVDVRVTRITRDRKDQAKIDDIVWSTLITIRRGNPFRAAGVAVSAIRVRAGEQASGQLDAINAVVQSIHPDWTGSAWVERATRNPASLARAVLQGNGNGRPLPDSRLDLAAFAEWHSYCQERGLTCDLVVDWDGATVDQVLRMVAACGHAVVLPVDGVWQPIIDRPTSTPVQVLTPRNLVSFEARRVLADQIHGLRVRFVDAAAGYRRAERVVYADGWSAATASRLDDLELPGITSADLAYRHARRRLAELRLRSATYTIGLDWEQLACRVGDRVEIAHDAVLAAVGWGRIRSLDLDGSGQVLSLQLDETVTLTAGVAYACTIRRPAGVATYALGAIAATGATDTIALATAIPSAQAPSVGDLVVVGEVGQVTIPALVTRLTPSADLSATIEAVPYHDGVYAADTEPIPPWTPRISVSALLPPPQIRSARREPTTGDVLVELTPLATSAVAVAAIELAWADDPDAAPALSSWPPDTTLARLAGVPTTDGITIRARARLISGTATAWSTPATITAGAGEIPPDVPAAWVDGDELVWRAPSVGEVAGYRIRYGPPGIAYELATPAHEGLIVGTRWSARNLPIDEAELLLVAVGRSGAESATPRRAAWARLDELTRYWTLADRDERALGWPGLVTEGSRSDQGISGRAFAALWPDGQARAWPDPAAPAFVSAASTAGWTYRARWQLPEEAEVGGATVTLGARDVVQVQPAVADGAIYTIEYAVSGEAPDEPFSDGRLFSSGRGWTRIASLPWLPWPRAIRASPGSTLRVRLRGSGTLHRLRLGVARQIRTVVHTSVTVPPTGITVPAPVDAVAVIGVHATSATSSRIVRAVPVAGGALIQAVDIAGAPADAVVSVRLEVI